MIDLFWKNKKVFITGHTGFKGSWLSLYLSHLGAHVLGFSKNIPTKPSLFEIAGINRVVQTVWGDIRNRVVLLRALKRQRPSIIIHMAAQALVRKSYQEPLDTFETNIQGTVNILELAREVSSVRVVLVVTSDKCYKNQEKNRGYREDEPLGGSDPYSASKACTEIVVECYRRSYFESMARPVSIPSARAGNVIGGGDWSPDRLMPDVMMSLIKNRPVVLRCPNSIRPWQHVLEPLSGYLMLIKLAWKNHRAFSQPFNFGPNKKDTKKVRWMVEEAINAWGSKVRWRTDSKKNFRETKTLMLDSSKSQKMIAWKPRWTAKEAIKKTSDWYQGYVSRKNLRALMLKQIDEYHTH